MTGTFHMAETFVRVRNKPAVAKRGFRPNVWVMLVATVFFGAAATFGYDVYSGRLGLIGPQPEIVESSAGRIIKVPPGGNVQAALEKANGGDIVELQAGAVYSGQINLPNKPITEYITIRSSAAADLPADKRVTPEQRSSMATIVSGMLGRAAVSAANGAHHYRFIGIEFTASGTMYNYGLVQFGTGEKRPENVPHDLEIDRSYIHPRKGGTTRRGIALNSANTVIKNSYIEGFAFPGEETQGICGWTGTRGVQIVNNYIEGGAENIMFGGADPDNASLIPTDIEVRGNHLNKPREWNGKTTLKTLFELKNARKVQFTGNLLTNNWVGSAFRITIRNQDGDAPFSTIEDVVIKDNLIDGAADGINILGKDDTHPSQTLKRLTIENNLFLNVKGGNEWDGSGYFIQVADGEDISILNNTVLNTGNIVTFYGTMPRNFRFQDNIAGHGSYGVHGPIDLGSPMARTMFQNNVFLNLNGIPSGDYAFPAGNSIVPGINDVKFADPAARDFRLSPASRYRGKGQGGKNIGSDLAPR